MYNFTPLIILTFPLKKNVNSMKLRTLVHTNFFFPLSKRQQGKLITIVPHALVIVEQFLIWTHRFWCSQKGRVTTIKCGKIVDS